MKQHTKAILIFLSVITMICGAQSPDNDRIGAQETQTRGYWIDPSTGLMWTAKDNGNDITWRKAMKYCQNLSLAGYSDWRLPTIDELSSIYDGNSFTAPPPERRDAGSSWKGKGRFASYRCS